MKNYFWLLLFLFPLTTKAQTQADAIGCWNMSYSMDLTKSGVALQLHRDSTYSYKDYNSQTRDYAVFTGKWNLLGEALQLETQTPNQPLIFTFKQVAKSGKWILIRTGGYELRKEDEEDCK